MVAFDSIDKIFNDIVKRYIKFFANGSFDGNPIDLALDEGKLRDEFEIEGYEDKDAYYDQSLPRNEGNDFTSELTSWETEADPVVRVNGEPTGFHDLEDPHGRGIGAFLDQPSMPDEFEHGIPSQRPAKEPFSETFKDEHGGTIINVDLAGVTERDVSVAVDGKRLRIEAHGASHHYQKSIQLDRSAVADDLSWRMNNGVLEIRIRAAER